MSHINVFVGAFFTQFTVIGLMFSFGVFFNEFEIEFGWSRTLLSSCAAIAFFVMGVLALVAGRMSDRYGPRLVLGFTGTLYGIGFALISQVSEPWHLVLIFATFIGAGMGTHDVVTLSAVARWFPNGRGLITGLAKVGTALGQMIMPPLAALLILYYDWRTAVICLGIMAAVLLIVSALLMTHPEEQQEELGVRSKPAKSISKSRQTIAFKQLCLIQFLFFPTLMTIPTHIAVHGMDLGMTSAKAALFLTSIGGASIAGRLIVGSFLDRMGSKKAYVACFIPIIISLFALLNITQYEILFGFMALYGFGHGGFFAVVSPTVAAYFGMKEHGALFGTILFFGTISGSIGPILTGFVFDHFGSYEIAFWGLLGLMLAGLLLVLALPSKDIDAKSEPKK